MALPVDDGAAVFWRAASAQGDRWTRQGIGWCVMLLVFFVSFVIFMSKQPLGNCNFIRREQGTSLLPNPLINSRRATRVTPPALYGTVRSFTVPYGSVHDFVPVGYSGYPPTHQSNVSGGRGGCWGGLVERCRKRFSHRLNHNVLVTS